MRCDLCVYIRVMLDGLERRFRWITIPKLTLYLVIGQCFFFVVGLSQPDVLEQLELLPKRVTEGQWWRLLLFMFMPSVSPGGSLNVVFMFFAMYLLWLMGGALESEWGSFRYTVFILIGYAATLGAAWIDPLGRATNGYILTSIFLAFAVLHPDFVIYLFFILPVKIRWLALATWIFLGIQTVQGSWQERGLILVSVANFLLFFWPLILGKVRGGHRRIRAQRVASQAAAEPFHQCVTCGRTERTDSRLEFRYAQMSEGVRCYCMDHLPDGL